jgi:serine dehydrogenase proteinase
MKRLLKSIFSLKGLVAVLFVLFIVMPIMQSWRIEKLRDDAISALEKKRGSRVIVLIHRQESVNVLGIPWSAILI